MASMGGICYVLFMAFSNKMTPEPTERLFFRHFQKTDLHAVIELNRDPEVMRYFPELKSIDEISLDFKRYLKYHLEHPGYGYWHTSFTHRGRHEFAGFFLVKILPETGETEIGYRLLPKYWGRGLATEGARAMVDYSLRNLRVDKVVGVASPENLASRRVLEKAGLEFRKYDRFYQVQCAYYSLEHR